MKGSMNMGIWEKFKSGLKKTSSRLEVALRFTKLDDESLQELEDALILTDMGAAQSAELVALMAKQKPQTQEQAKQILWHKIESCITTLWIDELCKTMAYKRTIRRIHATI